MSFRRLIGIAQQAKAHNSAAARHRSLRFESLERRALLTAVSSFAELNSAIETGQDSNIELTDDIVVTSAEAGETISLTAGKTFTIDGGSSGHTITVDTGVTRTAPLFTVSGGSLSVGNVTIDGFVYNCRPLQMP
ncbi:MAG: hypothetical protein IJG83_01285 [Thermoguttaceae bacterium]|nr:hypothetical protein [Thermoguttaceae bacterium]